jgi:hypothetical protein
MTPDFASECPSAKTGPEININEVTANKNALMIKTPLLKKVIRPHDRSHALLKFILANHDIYAHTETLHSHWSTTAHNTDIHHIKQYV